MNIAIVVSDFNREITASLLEGALAALEEGGVARRGVKVLHVPGAFEIPLAVQKLARTKKVDAIVALGCVIRGETVHFERICEAALNSLQRISLETGVPVTSGIVMAENSEQARARAAGREKHRGREAAQAALQMAVLLEGACVAPSTGKARGASPSRRLRRLGEHPFTK